MLSYLLLVTRKGPEETLIVIAAKKILMNCLFCAGIKLDTEDGEDPETSVKDQLLNRVVRILGFKKQSAHVKEREMPRASKFSISLLQKNVSSS